MRKQLVHSILIVMTVACYAGSAFASSTATIAETQFNAGNIEQGEIITHDFTFQNTGDEPLTLKVNDCGCGGLTFKKPSSPIKPGKTGTVTVNIPTIQRKGDFKREVAIVTNDPAKKDLKVAITARINESLSIVPQYIYFSPVTKGSINKKDIQLSNTGTVSFNIVSIEAAPSGVITIAPTLSKVLLKPGDKKSLHVTLSPPSAARNFEGSLVIKTDLKYLKEKNIIIRADAGVQ